LPDGKKGPRYKREFGQPQEKAQDNFTDPESRIMKVGTAFEQSYNAQACVDEQEQIIVAAGVVNCGADNGQLLPMVQATEANTERVPQQVVADAGYRSESNFEQLAAKNIDAVIALGRESKETRPISSKLKATNRMKEKLASPEGAAAYRRRKGIVEPVFGWIKSVLGFRQFNLRGLAKVNAEWHLICLALNLRRMSANLRLAD
jgi:IS5 family transposase